MLVLLANTKSSIYGDLGAKPLLSVLVAVNAKFGFALPAVAFPMPPESVSSLFERKNRYCT